MESEASEEESWLGLPENQKPSVQWRMGLKEERRQRLGRPQGGKCCERGQREGACSLGTRKKESASGRKVMG